LDDAVDRVAAALTAVRADDSFASRLNARLAAGSGWHVSWFGLVAGAAVATAAPPRSSSRCCLRRRRRPSRHLLLRRQRRRLSRQRHRRQPSPPTIRRLLFASRRHDSRACTLSNRFLPSTRCLIRKS
jgi:hypothetical protein